MNIEFTLTQDELNQRVVDALVEKLLNTDNENGYDGSWILKTVKSNIQDSVESIVRDVTEKHVASWVDERLSEPFYETNRYGERLRGKREATTTTVREIAMRALEKTMLEKVDHNGRPSDGYRTTGMTRVQFEATKAVRAMVVTEVESAVSTAVNEKIDKIGRDVLKDAIGTALYSAFSKKLV